eukprot:3177331-Amphidinium_carterae.1
MHRVPTFVLSKNTASSQWFDEALSNLCRNRSKSAAECRRLEAILTKFRTYCWLTNPLLFVAAK